MEFFARASGDATWSQKLEEAQRLANDGARQEFAKNYSEAFASYVRAGELYLWLVRTFDDEGRTHAGTSNDLSGVRFDLKARIRKAADKVLTRAQLIKSFKRDIKPVQKRILTDEEQARALAHSSAVGNIRVPVWRAPPPAAFEGILFSNRQATPDLAPLHIERNAAYKRPTHRPFWAKNSLFNVKRPLRGSDIVQDVINDCSFVASLEVAAEHDRRWNTNLAHAPLYPQDSAGFPVWSANGRHLVRLRLNGCNRSLEIDDAVPCDPDDIPMCAIGNTSGENESVQMWPALLEKAYLSLRGGYDFRGSNSSIDLHALTGWIPEHVGFRHAGFQREKMWSRLANAFRKGHLMLTAGTSKGTEGSNLVGQEPLIDSHNYAVLEVIDEGDDRKLILMNPWRHRQNSSRMWTEDIKNALPDDGYRRQGVFSMSWDEACSRMDALYLSWDPGLFTNSATFHAFWNLSSGRTETGNSMIGQNNQVIIDVDPAGANGREEVLVHLVKHITKQEQDNPTEWIAIHAFDCQDDKRIHDKLCIGTYVDSNHALTRFFASKGRYILVASRQVEQDRHVLDQSGRDASFSVTAYSNAKLRLEDLSDTYPFEQQLQGQWTARTAGGNSLQPTFMLNPQYQVSVASNSLAGSPVRLRVIAETSRDVPIQVMVVWATMETGKEYARRVDHVTPGDVVCSSGSYSYGLAIAESASVRPNTPYMLIVSTYNAGQEAHFTLHVQTQYSEAEVKSIPSEGAGMHQYKFRDCWSVQRRTACGAPRHGRYRGNPTYSIEVTRPTYISARLAVSSPRGAMDGAEDDMQPLRRRPLVNIAVLDPESGREVVSSGPYADHVCGASLHRTMLESGVYHMIASTFDPDVEAGLNLSVYSDRPLIVKKLV